VLDNEYWVSLKQGLLSIPPLKKKKKRGYHGISYLNSHVYLKGLFENPL
jgi:hypothetical protein